MLHVRSILLTGIFCNYSDIVPVNKGLRNAIPYEQHSLLAKIERWDEVVADVLAAVLEPRCPLRGGIYVRRIIGRARFRILAWLSLRGGQRAHETCSSRPSARNRKSGTSPTCGCRANRRRRVHEAFHRAQHASCAALLGVRHFQPYENFPPPNKEEGSGLVRAVMEARLCGCADIMRRQNVAGKALCV